MIALKFGASDEHIKVKSHPKCTMNLISIHGVLNVYTHLKKSNFCHNYRVNCIWEQFEFGALHRLVLVAVSFNG